MSWWSRGAASWRDLAREQLLEMLRPIRGDAPGPGNVVSTPTTPITPPPPSENYITQMDGSLILLQLGGYLIRQVTGPPANVILDTDGMALIDTDGGYVTES